MPLPTPERDLADQAELELGLTDPIEVIAKRRNLTLEQAEEAAEAIAERRAKWNAIQTKHGLDMPADPNKPDSNDPGGSGDNTEGETDPTEKKPKSGEPTDGQV